MCHVFGPMLYVVCLEWYVKAWRFSCKSFESGAVSRSYRASTTFIPCSLLLMLDHESVNFREAYAPIQPLRPRTDESCDIFPDTQSR
jgi:hypothetical protein